MLLFSENRFKKKTLFMVLDARRLQTDGRFICAIAYIQFKITLCMLIML